MQPILCKDSILYAKRNKKCKKYKFLARIYHNCVKQYKKASYFMAYYYYISVWH